MFLVRIELYPEIWANERKTISAIVDICHAGGLKNISWMDGVLKGDIPNLEARDKIMGLDCVKSVERIIEKEAR